jgi:hypothetical protein
MSVITCNTSDVVNYSSLCLGDNPPDDCFPKYNPLATFVWLTFFLVNRGAIHQFIRIILNSDY